MATPQTILAEFPCGACSGANLFETLEIGILRTTLTELGAPMTQAQIDAASACYTCFGMSQAQAAILVLLNAVSENISGGGGGTAGSGSPEGVVTANPGSTYLDTSNGSFYAKQTGTGNTGWLPLIV